MSAIPSVISLIMVMVILLFLQLVPATFSIFYHYALGRFSSKKSDSLSLSFIFGTEFFHAIMWLLTYFIVYGIFANLPNFNSHIILWVLAGIVTAEAIIFFCCYFRHVKPRSRAKASTALFLSRRFASNLSARARTVQRHRDAFLLGFFTGVPELIFTLPLFVAANLILVHSLILPAALIVIIAIILVTAPLFTIRTAFRAGLNLADIQRFRAALCPALRFFTPLCYLALSAALINLGLL